MEELTPDDIDVILKKLQDGEYNNILKYILDKKRCSISQLANLARCQRRSIRRYVQGE